MIHFICNPDDLVDLDLDLNEETQPGHDTDILPAKQDGIDTKANYSLDTSDPTNNSFMQDLGPESMRPLGLKRSLFIAIVIALGFLVVIVAYLLVN